jgi:hypothetical protein
VPVTLSRSVESVAHDGGGGDERVGGGVNMAVFGPLTRMHVVFAHSVSITYDLRCRASVCSYVGT